jgi:hypothetical protein
MYAFPSDLFWDPLITEQGSPVNSSDTVYFTGQ